METLKDLTRCHQHIIRLSEILDDIFDVPNLLNVLLGSLQICFLGFTIMMGTWSQIPQSVFLLSSILLQLLMMSYFGENIMSESRRVGDAAFQCNWYNMDGNSKKMIHVLILRSQKSQHLTTYKFSKISFASFTTLISKSWSYFSILKTIYRPPDRYS
ncbi:odorant receptor 67c-like [Plodia interpunctella]|uniref:odorant receptor 67c-like n=1 Tax=Plodia interpunctella TaxID=58824 RepID=UPI0023681A49|nr:odorant receptor 67c-like [Plodia interpunctella]